MIISNRTRTNPIYNKVYFTWHNMMKRCYNADSKDYQYYGAKGISVCEEWKIFKNFESDVDKIEGFDLDKFLNTGLSLDKDKKNPENKIYSLDTCCFVSREENNKYKPNQQRVIVAIAPDGSTYSFTNQSEFARKHNLTQGTISDCARNNKVLRSGWSFCFKQD